MDNTVNIHFKDDGCLKLLIIVGTRPEVIRLSEVIKKCRRHFDCLLAHTGQNYDYTLNGIFFRDLSLDDPDVYLDAVGADLGETVGNIIAASYKLMVQVKPDALLILGDTNSCLSAIAAKRLHIPIFHMEAGNRCKDECLPEETNRRIVDVISDVNLAYSEHARRYLKDTGCAPERTYVTGSPMAEVLRANLEKIQASDVLTELAWSPSAICCFRPTARRTSTPRPTSRACSPRSTRWRINTTCRSCTPATRAPASDWRPPASSWTRACACTSPWDSTTTTACR